SNHRFFRAELQAAGRTRFDARRLESDFDAVDAQRALLSLSSLRVELRHVERTTGRAVAAADAFRRVDVDDAVRVLHDRARRGTRFEASRLRAMHTLIVSHEPHDVAVRVGALAAPVHD